MKHLVQLPSAIVAYFITFLALSTFVTAAPTASTAQKSAIDDPLRRPDPFWDQRTDHNGSWTRGWIPKFDPWDDLQSMDESVFETKSPEEYYSFTEENIAASRVLEWYSEWTTAREHSTEVAKHGEWKAWVREFTGEVNWDCAWSHDACLYQPSLLELRELFPNYPHLVRRVHFILTMYAYWHDMKRTAQNAIYMAADMIVGDLERIMSTVQLQPDPSAEQRCQMYHQIIDETVSLALAVGSIATEGMLGPMVQALPKLGTALSAIDRGAHNLAMNNFGQAVEGLEKEEIQALRGATGFWARYDLNHRENGVRMSAPVFQGVSGWVNNKLYSWKEYSYQLSRVTGNIAYSIDAGKDMDPMCSSFKGGLVIDSKGNAAQMEKNVRAQISVASHMLTNAYEVLYNGAERPPNNTESLTAFTFRNQKWEGFNSITKDMQNSNMLQTSLERALAMSIATAGARMDMDYIECTRDSKALETCAKAATAPPCTGVKRKDCLRGVFCPEPAKDPTVICAAKKWYYAKGTTPGHGGGYETDLPSLEKWEGFLDGRYNVTRQAILQSSWDKFRREVDGVQEINDLDYGCESYEQKRLAGGFWLPICYREDIDIFSGQFPATCGLDWRNFYTGEFLSEINMGDGSKFWVDDQDEWPNPVILSHIPLVLEQRSKSPLERFLGYCSAKIRFPDTRTENTNNHRGDINRLARVHRGSDSSCDFVLNRIQDMTRPAADHWFCSNEGSKEHHVFEHEFGWVKVADLNFPGNHQKYCISWNRQHKNDKWQEEDPSIDWEMAQTEDGKGAMDIRAVRSMIESYRAGNWTAQFKTVMATKEGQTALTDEQEQHLQNLTHLVFDISDPKDDFVENADG